MEKNVGGLDRTVRLILGPVLAVFGVAVVAGYLDLGLTGIVGLAVAVLVLAVGTILSVTGATQQCPANELAGLDTYDQE